MILLADQPPRVNQLHLLAIFVLLALFLLPADSNTLTCDSPDDGGTVYTFCTAARTVQAVGPHHALLAPVAGCAIFVFTFSKLSTVLRTVDDAPCSYPTPLMILRL